MKKLFISNTSIALLLLFHLPLFSQSFTQSSLPIVILNTGGDTIPDEPKIPANMGIIFNGAGFTNFLTDPSNHYNGNIAIETRGNSTQDFDKKTYSLETKNVAQQDSAVALLGMGKDEDWILHAMVIDKSQLRIPMSFYFSQRMGHYASNWRFVELVLNGDYQGLYILTEKIKRDDDRVNIAKLDGDDLAGDSLTGGYILRIDWLDSPLGFASNYNSQEGVPMFFQWYYPKTANIQPQQAAYIQNWMNTFEEAVFATNYTNSQGVRYNDYLDVNSFTDFLLINELSKNSDGYKLSSFLYKDKDSKGGNLVSGPIWDFDQTYGMSEVCSNHDYTGWTYLQNQPNCEDLESMPMWWQQMMSDQVFTNHLACRWQTFRNSFLHIDSINHWIDQHVGFIQLAADRNFVKWPFIGQEIWAEPHPIPQSYADEIVYMKNWIQNRLNWIDANLPGNCADDVLSVPEKSEKLKISVFPNPGDRYLKINHNKKGRLNLCDIRGKLLTSTQVDPGVLQLNVSNFSPGVYLIHFTSERAIYTQIVVIK